MSGARRREWTAAVAIAAIAFALRALHALARADTPLAQMPIMDMAYHLEWARSVAAGETFQPGEPFFRAPLYPWFAGLCLKVFGGSLTAVRLVQAALGALSCLLTWSLGRAVFGGTVGLIASGLFAVAWIPIHFDGLLLIPTLLVPLVLLALRATVSLRVDRPEASPSLRSAVLAGVAWGLAAIARPNVLLAMPLLGLWLLLHGGGRRWAALAMLTLGTLVPILPLTAYNAVAAKDPALISTQAGLNLWIGNNPSSDGTTAIVPGTRPGWWTGHFDAYAQAEKAEGRPLRPSEVSQHFAGRAAEWVTSDPKAAAALTLHKARMLVSKDELGNNVDPRTIAFDASPWLRASPVRFSAVLALAVAGMILARGPRRTPLLLFLAAYSVSIVVFFVNSRFRAPMLAPMMVLAAAGLVESSRLVRTRDLRRLAFAAVAAAPVLAISLWPTGNDARMRANGQYTLAVSHLQRGQRSVDGAQKDADLARAEEHLRAALEISPRYGSAIQLLAVVTEERGDVDTALGIWREAVAGSPGSETLEDGLLGTLFRAKRFEELQTRALEMHRAGSASGSYHLAVLAILQNRLDRATKLLATSEERYPGRYRVPSTEAAIARKRGDPAGERACLERAVEREAEASRTERRLLWSKLADLRAAAGDEAGARAARRRLQSVR